jgi:hypothetical protein
MKGAIFISIARFTKSLQKYLLSKRCCPVPLCPTFKKGKNIEIRQAVAMLQAKQYRRP